MEVTIIFGRLTINSSQPRKNQMFPHGWLTSFNLVFHHINAIRGIVNHLNVAKWQCGIVAFYTSAYCLSSQSNHHDANV